MLHFSQRMEWVFKNRALENLIKFERKKIIFSASVPPQKNFKIFFLIFTQNPSLTPKIRIVFQQVLKY